MVFICMILKVGFFRQEISYYRYKNIGAVYSEDKHLSTPVD